MIAVGGLNPREGVCDIWGMKPFTALLVLALLAGGCASNPKPEGPAVVRELLTTGYCKCGRCTNWEHTTFLRRTVIKN